MRAVSKRLSRRLSTFLCILLFLAAMLLCGVRLFGLIPYAVLSQSMRDIYPKGSLIYVKKAEAEDIFKGDIITFYIAPGVTATHRVIEIDREKGCFYTKGDENTSPDAGEVYFYYLVGKPVFHIEGLGYVSFFLKTFAGKITVALSAVACMLLSFFGRNENEDCGCTNAFTHKKEKGEAQ